MKKGARSSWKVGADPGLGGEMVPPHWPQSELVEVDQEGEVSQWFSVTQQVLVLRRFSFHAESRRPKVCFAAWYR